MAIRHYWSMAAAAIGFRLVLVLFGGDLHLASRPEVSTPLTSLRRRKCPSLHYFRFYEAKLWYGITVIRVPVDFICALQLQKATG